MFAFQAPLPRTGRSPMLSLTVIARNGAPFATLRTAFLSVQVKQVTNRRRSSQPHMPFHMC